MDVPQEVVWIEQLINGHGLAGTLQMISVNCRDRATRWQQCAEVVDTAIEHVNQIQPPPCD